MDKASWQALGLTVWRCRKPNDAIISPPAVVRQSFKGPGYAMLWIHSPLSKEEAQLFANIQQACQLQECEACPPRCPQLTVVWGRHLVETVTQAAEPAPLIALTPATYLSQPDEKKALWQALKTFMSDATAV